jgi:hypothetical protein
MPRSVSEGRLEFLFESGTFIRRIADQCGSSTRFDVIGEFRLLEAGEAINEALNHRT